MSMLEIHELLERLGNLMRSQIRGEADAHGLKPVHLNALHYLSICNRYSDTLLGLSEYLGQTRGTTSQTIKLLEERGWIAKKPDATDGRVTHLKLLPAGKKVIHRFWPSPVLQAVKEKVPARNQALLRDSLRYLLQLCQQANRKKTFGVCKTCHYHQRSREGAVCGLTQEPLKDRDVTQICREHEFPVGA